MALIDADEGVHAVGAAGNWNESRYVDFWDADSRVGGWLRIGLRPNEHRAEMSVCVYLPDGRIAFRFERAPIDGNGLSAGGQSWQVDAPYMRNTAQYRGPVHVLEDGWLLADPRLAYTAAEQADCAIDLTMLSRGLPAVMGSDPDHIDRIFLPGQADFHYQHLAWTAGTIRIGDRTWAVTGQGGKDHSWGPRNWHAKTYLRWHTGVIDADTGFMLLRGVGPTKQTRGGHVWEAGRFHLVDDFEMRNEYAGPPHFELRSVGLTIHARDRTWVTTGTPQGLVAAAAPPTGCVRSGSFAVTDLARDLAAAAGWLTAHIAGLPAPLSFERIRGGHSNITVRVTSVNGRSVALRRPPYGALPRGAHDVVREARTVAALAGSGVPVPDVLAVCTDDDVLGAPFSVTAWIDGTVAGTPDAVAAALPTAADRRRITEQLVATLARLHLADPEIVGPPRAGPPYLERQLTRLMETRAASDGQPQVAELAGRLHDVRPADPRVGIVHADYRLGNCMIGSGGRLLAVLDWELSACGDVLADLGYLLNNWEQPDEPGRPVWMQTPPTRAGGFPDRAFVLQRYAELTGFDTADVGYYRGFAAWRMAVIAEGIKHRYQDGAMADSDVDHAFLGQRVVDLLAQSDRHLRAIGA